MQCLWNTKLDSESWYFSLICKTIIGYVIFLKQGFLKKSVSDFVFPVKELDTFQIDSLF